MYEYVRFHMTMYDYDLTMYANVWLCVTLFDCICLYMTMYDYVWLYSNSLWVCLPKYDFVLLYIPLYDDSVRPCRTIHDYIWLCIALYDYVWLCISKNEYIPLCVTLYDSVRICIWLCMIMHDYICLPLQDTISDCMTLLFYPFLLCFALFDSFAWFGSSEGSHQEENVTNCGKSFKIKIVYISNVD